MNRSQAQEEANKRGLGYIHFQFNIARNTGREFEVGYVVDCGSRELFCKRQSNSTEDDFYLCNQYR
jgi:hypothetical protein